MLHKGLAYSAAMTWSGASVIASICHLPLLRLGMGSASGAVPTRMKLIVAIIKPFKLDEVKDALTALPITGMTVTEVRGIGRQKGHNELYRGSEYVIDFLPKTRIELAVTDAMADAAVKAIVRAGTTAKIGDGKVFVFPLEEAVRIRTEDRGDPAL
jgi:nitrogen regulatory protein PII